jgi:hypothetical protein
MPLVDLDFSGVLEVLPADVRSFLREADRRIERFQRTSRVPAFVPSDFGAAFGVLKELADTSPRAGRLFCEWGSATRRRFQFACQLLPRKLYSERR